MGAEDDEPVIKAVEKVEEYSAKSKKNSRLDKVKEKDKEEDDDETVTKIDETWDDPAAEEIPEVEMAR